MQLATAPDILADAPIGDNSDCVFCPSSLLHSVSDFDRPLDASNEALLIPALGMLVPGYLLAITRLHVPSLAYMSNQSIEGVYEWLGRATAALAPQFGNYALVEHGGCPATASGSCIDHAHIHAVPLSDRLRTRVFSDARLRFSRVTEAEELARLRGRGYISYVDDSGFWVSTDAAVPSQWIRRLIGEELGTDAWDWALNPGLPNLRRTLQSVGTCECLSKGHDGPEH